jgi:quercetin dioxygenase-like cupin family protein
MSRTLKITPSEFVTVRTNTPELLDMEATFEPVEHRPPKHWHPDQDEHFEVYEGTLTANVGGREVVLRAGDVLDIPRGTVHSMWNSGSERARVLWQVRPAGRTQQWFASIDAVHQSGRVGRDGMPGILAYAVFLTEFRDVFRLATPAAPVVRALLAVLAPIGRLRGYRPTSTVDSPSSARSTRPA